MKSLFRSFISTMMVLSIAGFAQAGKELNNGGNDLGLEFKTIATQSLGELAKSGLVDSTRLERLQSALNTAVILAVDEPLPVMISGITQYCAAVNDAKNWTIKISKKWILITDIRVKQALAIHELEGLIGEEATGVYQLSASFLIYLGYGGSTDQALAAANGTKSSIAEKPSCYSQERFQLLDRPVSIIQKGVGIFISPKDSSGIIIEHDDMDPQQIVAVHGNFSLAMNHPLFRINLDSDAIGYRDFCGRKFSSLPSSGPFGNMQPWIHWDSMLGSTSDILLNGKWQKVAYGLNIQFEPQVAVTQACFVDAVKMNYSGGTIDAKGCFEMYPNGNLRSYGKGLAKEKFPFYFKFGNFNVNANMVSFYENGRNEFTQFNEPYFADIPNQGTVGFTLVGLSNPAGKKQWIDYGEISEPKIFLKAPGILTAELPKCTSVFFDKNGYVEKYILPIATNCH